MKRVLAVSSGGGHWVQLLRLAPAFSGHQTTYVTVGKGYRTQVPGFGFYAVNDASRWNPLGLILLAVRIFRIVLKERPDVVISTGAAPGLFAVLAAWLLSIRTVWVDSIANVDRLSLCGRLVRPIARLHLTQWPRLARGGRPAFLGAVL